MGILDLLSKPKAKQQNARPVRQPARQNILERIASTVDNNITAPVRRGVVGAVEAINPYDAESKGNNLINSANSEYGFTPQFKSILDRTNPYVTDGAWSKSEGLKGASAGGLYYPKKSYGNMNSRLRIAPGDDGVSRDNLMHEGLHAAYDAYSPDQRQEYLRMVQRVLPNDRGMVQVSPTKKVLAPRDYIDSTLKEYSDYGGSDASDVARLPDSLQDELHSYLPSYYKTTGQRMPRDLANYYKKYYTRGL